MWSRWSAVSCSRARWRFRPSITSSVPEEIAGSLGDACGFSFFPSKNLGAFGDGGMVVTNRDDTAERLRRLRVHGGRQMYHHEEVGYNSRLDSLQAAVLSVKLPHLSAWSDARRQNARFYDGALEGLEGLRTPVIDPSNETIFNQYTLRVLDGRRDDLAAFLKERGVGNSIYYPLPLHLQECFGYLGYQKGAFPHAEQAAREVLSIPVFPELTDEQKAVLRWDEQEEYLARTQLYPAQAGG